MAYDPNDAADKKLLEDAVAAAIAEHTEGLAKKNRELLAELKEAKKGKQVDPAEVERLEAQLEEVKGQLAEATKASKEATKAAKEASDKLATESGFTTKLLVDNGLSDALAKVGVAPQFLPAVKAMLAPQVAIVMDGENRVAKVGDKTLADHVTLWSQSDEGKHYVAAKNNGGGGANGGGANGGGKTTTRTAFEGMDAAGRSSFLKEGGTVTD